MSIVLKEISISDETAPNMPTKRAETGLTMGDINRIVAGAVATALDQAQTRADSMIAELDAKIAAVAKPKNVVMAVEVDGHIRKLGQTASPALGRMIVNAKIGVNTMLVGPAGSGKTFAAAQLAKALGLPFGHLCCTAGASETWLFGRQTANGFIEGSFSKAVRNGGVFLLDEWDAADANFALAVNTVAAGGDLYNPILGELIPRHADFVLVFACNTIGKGGSSVYTGRSRLDGSSLNRAVMLAVGYCPQIEMEVCPDEELRTLLQSARAKLADLKSLEIVSTRTLDYAYRQFKAGISLSDILESLTMGWPDGIAKQCGVDPAAHKQKPVQSKPKKAAIPVAEPPTAAEAYPF